MANLDMSEFVKAMRSVINSQLSSYGLTEYRIGEVVKESPLEIKISDRITLNESKLILTEQVLLKQLDLTHVHQILGDTESAGGPAMHTHAIDFDSQKSLTTLITITEGLKVGDFVHLLSVMKGQKFIVLSKVRDKKSVVINKEDQWKWS